MTPFWKLKKVQLFICCFLMVGIVSLLLFPETSLAGSPQKQPHILLLNSYHPGFRWSDGEQAGILETLKAKHPDVQLHIEYLDTKNFSKPDHYNFLCENLSYKYSGQQFSVIIAMDNAALEFLVKCGKQLFGDTPVVFCGVSNFSPDMLNGITGFTGVVERHDVRPTIELMLRLHPDAREIYAVVDDTLTGREVRRNVESLLPMLSRQVTVTFTDNPTIEEIVSQTRNLGPDSLILLLPFSRDRNGKVVGHQELNRLVSADSPVPVYVFREERMGPGVMGGYLQEGANHGRQAAQLVLRILQGEAASSIPVIFDPPGHAIFDYQQLKRFGIRESALPRDSRILNKPASLYESYRETVWAILSFVFLLLCVIVALLINIRKRRQVEDVLGRQRAMLREVLDMTPQSIFWKDRESVYLGCNAVFAKTVGLADPEQIVGKTDFDLPWPREEAEAYRADDREVIAINRAKRHIVEPLQQADGSRLWIDTSKVPLQDSQGQAYGVLGVYEDVTEKKKVEEQLRLAQFTIDNAQDCIFLVDEDGRFHFVNESACRRLGYAREELLAMRVFDIAPNLHENRWPEHWRELMEKGSMAFETVQRTKDGEVFPVEVNINWVTQHGKAFNCAFTRDISERKCADEERKKLEMQLRQSQKMEAIGTLAGGIAHDFNNILSVIFGYAELAMIEDDDPVKRREDLDQVLAGAVLAKELVRQILAFSRKSEQQKQPLQISLTVKESLKMMRASIPATIEIRQQINSEGAVLADPSQVYQIVMNLCANASYAMRGKGGILTVSLDEVNLSPEECGCYTGGKPGRYLKLDVSDTGCGITPEIKDNIFEPYFTTKPLGEGTGMGLAVVHGIVKSHNGHISVASEVGQGTSVHVYLPLIEAETAFLPADRPVVEDIDGHGEQILFVDDEEQICAYVGTVLKKHGYQVAVFADAEEAFREFEKQIDRFDLLITDMSMPHMTGTELAQRVRAARPGMPVIFCTGHSFLGDREKAMAMEASDFLNKPVASRELLEVIHKAIGKNRCSGSKDDGTWGEKSTSAD